MAQPAVPWLAIGAASSVIHFSGRFRSLVCLVVTPEKLDTPFTCHSAPWESGCTFAALGTAVRRTRAIVGAAVIDPSSNETIAPSGRVAWFGGRTDCERISLGAPPEGPRLEPVGAHPVREDHYSNAGWLSSGTLSKPLYTADHSPTVHNGTVRMSELSRPNDRIGHRPHAASVVVAQVPASRQEIGGSGSRSRVD